MDKWRDPAADDYRKLYRLKAWQLLREQALLRDALPHRRDDMTEVLTTGEWTDEGYEYPPKCPLDICGDSAPIAMSLTDDKWQCDQCGKVFINWKQEVIQ